MLPQSYISRCIRAFRRPQLHPCHPAQSVNVQHQPTCRGIPDGIPETLKMKKALENQGLSSVVWRRGGDSNPRGAINACLISSQVHSTALPPLQMVPANRAANDKGHRQRGQAVFHIECIRPAMHEAFRQCNGCMQALAVHLHERDDAMPFQRKHGPLGHP